MIIRSPRGRCAASMVRRPRSGALSRPQRWEKLVRALLVTLGIVAAVLIVLGLVIKAVKWLIILGLIALVAAIVMGVVKGRRTLR